MIYQNWPDPKKEEFFLGNFSWGIFSETQGPVNLGFADGAFDRFVFMGSVSGGLIYVIGQGEPPGCDRAVLIGSKFESRDF